MSKVLCAYSEVLSVSEGLCPCLEVNVRVWRRLSVLKLLAVFEGLCSCLEVFVRVLNVYVRVWRFILVFEGFCLC